MEKFSSIKMAFDWQDQVYIKFIFLHRDISIKVLFPALFAFIVSHLDITVAGN